MVETLTAVMDRPESSCVLAVSHGSSCATFLRHWEAYNVEQYRPHIKNCTIFHFAYDEAARTFSCQHIVAPDDALIKRYLEESKGEHH